ncbi:hypothetical protein [Roseovarius aestuariivivens]|uniref:hypothetical protein n=1 Tax=Roseovarius aestuariivivens TaxID=1888910 RepID=UPI0010820DD4|nr:hypothetical protein [Roseovarius aestuariivivens]
MTARLTLVTSIRPAKLSKAANRIDNGRVSITGGGVLVEGDTEILKIASLHDLKKVLERLEPNQALTFGIPRDGDKKLLSRKELAKRGAPTDFITRTRDEFCWPSGPGILMLDHDPGEQPFFRDDLVAAIRQAVPGLKDMRMLWWPSASSHIFDEATDEDLTGLRGQRVYLMVTDATDIPRAGAALVDRLWAAGYGYIKVSTAGAALERSPIDASVWQPERLDFAAGAICGPGLVQRRGEPKIINGMTETLDSRLVLQDDKAIAKVAEANRRKAKAAASSRMKAARDAFIVMKAKAMLPAEDRADEDKMAAARGAVERAVDSRVLSGDFLVEVETSAGRFETVPVAQILEDRPKFHGHKTRDPIEPGYDGGRAVGKLFLLDARPTLFSFARHGHNFRLIKAKDRIEVPKGRLSAATDAAVDVLRKEPTSYDFGGQVSLVFGAKVVSLDEHALGHFLANVIQFWVLRKVDGVLTEVDIDPPQRLVRQILSLGDRRQLKPLLAIADVPTIRPDGTVITQPGYDEDTSLFLALSENTDIKLNPSRDEVTDALGILMRPFEDFPLVDKFARGALLSALLTAAIRPTLSTSPAFALDAPVQGAGKTLLASCIAALATGHPPQVWPHTAGRDDEEIRKRLFAALRDGTTALVWDNITGVFDSAALAAAITAPALRDRILGRSETLNVPNRALFLLTGNNLCPAGDLPRRIIPVRIDPKTDAPFAREFDLDPLKFVLDRRIDLVCAALCLIRGWLSANAERAAGRMASFEDWDDLVRQTVVWVGTEIAPGRFGDPLELVSKAQAGDPEQESLFALLTALHDGFGSKWFTARDVCNRAGLANVGAFGTDNATAIATAIVELGGDRALRSTKSVGRILEFRKGRIVLGLRLQSKQGRNGRDYRVETVEKNGAGGFGAFGGFESDASDASQSDARIEPDQAETNPPKPRNPQSSHDNGREPTQ